MQIQNSSPQCPHVVLHWMSEGLKNPDFHIYNAFSHWGEILLLSLGVKLVARNTA